MLDAVLSGITVTSDNNRSQIGTLTESSTSDDGDAVGNDDPRQVEAISERPILDSRDAGRDSDLSHVGIGEC